MLWNELPTWKAKVLKTRKRLTTSGAQEMQGQVVGLEGRSASKEKKGSVAEEQTGQGKELAREEQSRHKQKRTCKRNNMTRTKTQTQRAKQRMPIW